MILSDYHIHTAYSFDADKAASVDAVCRAAIEKGIPHVAITDHFDLNGFVEGIYPPTDLESARRDMQCAKARYADKLSLAVGIELGQVLHYPDEARDVLSRYEFDYVLGSVHNLKGMADFYYFDYTIPDEETLHAVWDQNLDEFIALSRCGLVNTIAHLTYLFRYLAQYRAPLSQERHMPKLRRLFESMIEHDVALEINTSSLATELGDTMPSMALVSLYRSLGGELITLGSDAHTPARIGYGMQDVQDRLKDMGFRYVTVWHGQKPTMLPLT